MYLVYSNIDGETGQYETEEEAMKEATELMDEYLDVYGYESPEITIFRALRRIETEELDSKEKAQAEGREWPHQNFGVLVEKKVVEL